MITEREDAFEVSATDLVVSACRREPYALRIEFSSGNRAWTLRVGGAFSIVQKPANIALETIEAVGNLAGHSVVAIRARKTDGELEVRFDDGRVLIVEPDADYEAWEMYSTRGERLIAVPGDGVAKWGEVDE